MWLCTGERLRTGNLCFCSSPILILGINHIQVCNFSQSKKNSKRAGGRRIYMIKQDLSSTVAASLEVCSFYIQVNTWQIIMASLLSLTETLIAVWHAVKIQQREIRCHLRKHEDEFNWDFAWFLYNTIKYKWARWLGRFSQSRSEPSSAKCLNTVAFSLYTTVVHRGKIVYLKCRRSALIQGV